VKLREKVEKLREIFKDREYEKDREGNREIEIDRKSIYIYIEREIKREKRECVCVRVQRRNEFF